MSRRWLIILSLAVHAAVALGLFVTGIWRIERLDYRHRASLAIGAPMLGDMGGGEGDEEPAEEPKKKEQKKKKKDKPLKEIREDIPAEKKPDEPVEVATNEDTSGGGGGGEGTDPLGVGPGGGGGGACDPLVDPDQCKPDGAPAIAACGNGIVEAAEQCDDGNTASGDRCSATCKIEEEIVPPQILAGLRIAGETHITPPDTVKTQMLRDGKQRTVASFQICIDRGGAVRHVKRMGKGTTYDAYDEKILRTMRVWRYRAYTVNGRPAPACSVVTFVYTIR